MRNRLAGTLLLLFVFLCTSWAQTSGLRKMIDLSGTWSFALDPHGKGEQEKLWNMDCRNCDFTRYNRFKSKRNREYQQVGDHLFVQIL